VTEGEQTARVIDKATAIAEGIFHHTLLRLNSAMGGG